MVLIRCGTYGGGARMQAFKGVLAVLQNRSHGWTKMERKKVAPMGMEGGEGYEKTKVVERSVCI